MVISKNTQLGLIWLDKDAMIDFCRHSKSFLDNYIHNIQGLIDDLRSDKDDCDLKAADEADGHKTLLKINERLGYDPKNVGSEFYTIKHPNPIYYLIQKTVYECSEKIRVSDNFSCSVFGKIKDGHHFYLMGKNEMYSFIKFNGVIRASYWSRSREIAFEFGFDLEEDKYYFPSNEKSEFNRLVKLMIFIELGDIEVVEIEKGRNNGKAKNEGKITNTSDYTVYVVDSSWNKLIIRTDGFAVMGHFRLQPCGAALKERKLIWINAFEKHGYKRRPRAEIVD
jgi:hypothetical protein